jgi:hypothetical protein
MIGAPDPGGADRCRSSTPLGEYDETVEGAWVVKKVEAPWATVELFGRRHRFDTVLIEASW